MADIGDRIFVVLGGRIIVPAKIKKTYPNSKTVWWEPVGNASDGKWRTCSYRTANYFLNLVGAKIRVMQAIAKERDELLARYDDQIEQVKQFEEKNLSAIAEIEAEQEEPPNIEHCGIYSFESKE